MTIDDIRAMPWAKRSPQACDDMCYGIVTRVEANPEQPTYRVVYDSEVRAIEARGELRKLDIESVISHESDSTVWMVDFRPV